MVQDVNIFGKKSDGLKFCFITTVSTTHPSGSTLSYHVLSAFYVVEFVMISFLCYGLTPLHSSPSKKSVAPGGAK